MSGKRYMRKKNPVDKELLKHGIVIRVKTPRKGKTKKSTVKSLKLAMKESYIFPYMRQKHEDN